MIYRVLYDGVDIHTNSVPDVLINPTVETEMNTAGSFTFTLPPDHFAWGDIYVFKGNVEVYENNDLIFFGRVANVDQNWNNERVVECEGALAFFNDSIQRPNSWTSNTLISQFLSDILDNHNAQVPDNRKIYLGNVTIDDMYVTRETNYEKTLDVLTRMCIDTNGGYFSLRKDEDDGKIYLDWLKDLTDVAAQPVEFGLNLLDISRSLHAEDIVTGVLARGGEVNDVKIDLHEVGEIDDPSIPVIHHTNQDPDILWHRDGLEGYGRVVQVKEFNDCTTVDGDNGLLAKATEWLIKQNTDIDTIEVDAAELGYFGESYPIFLLGQKVLVNSHPHHLENVELPMYKISMNLDSGTKRISIGTPPKRELTQISASNMGGGSGSSSSGGGSGSGGVQDVRVNGTSVVQDGIARVEVPTDTVTESEMSTAISTAVSGKANQSDLESLATAVSGKANTSDVNSALALKADKTEIPEIEANPSDAATDTLNKIDIDGTVYQLAGGTEVEANPSESATDDLETIKIGDTVYDIPGGGSSTNYGKFKCDVLFVNDPLPSATSGTSMVSRTYTLNNPISEYDALYVVAYGQYNGNQPGDIHSRLILKNTRDSYAEEIISSWGNTIKILYLHSSSDTSITTESYRGDYGNEPILYKVYGLKFENKLINRSDIYSEDEIMIGRWTDGKPLYQKVIHKNGLPVNSDEAVYNEPSNIDIMISIEDHFHFLSNVDVGNNYYASDSDQYRVYRSQGKIYVACYNTSRSASEMASASVDIVIQYTKTTDAPDSGVIPEDPMIISDPMIFSEEEQVVGSWTDGKPIYQKTVIVSSGSLSSGSMNVPTTGITNVEKCIDWSCRLHSNSEDRDFPIPYDRITYSESIQCLVHVLADHTINCTLHSGDRSSYSNIGDICITFKYTKTTDSILSGPKKGKIVQRSDIYSEEERLIGRWTDGKPLYQKVADVSIPSGNLNTWIDHNISGLTNATIVDYNYDILYPDEPSIGRNGYAIGGYEIQVCRLTSTNFYIIAGSGWNTGNIKIRFIIRYTKTTDAPFSKQLIEDPQFVMMSDIYSEEEQVVGRWTDGKPLYQKSITIHCSDYGAGSNTIPHNISNVDKIFINHSATFFRDGNGNACPYIKGGYGNNAVYISGYDDKIFQSVNASSITLKQQNSNDVYGTITLQYTKTTDVPGTGPTKGNLIYLPALYSEEEREVGVWTDGKPLYQKTWIFSSSIPISYNSFTNTTIDSSNIENIVCVKALHDDGTCYEGIMADPTMSSHTLVGLQTTRNGDTAFVKKLTLQYTKTTDQPGSGTWTPEGQLAHHYSTSEKIVGTWIDGSTVYEKTFNIGSMTAGSNKRVSASLSIDKVIDISGNAHSSNYNQWIKINFPHQNITAYIVTAVYIESSQEINVYTGTDFTLDECYITLQYTKTS